MNKDINLVSADSINAVRNPRLQKVKAIGTFSLLAIGSLSVLLFLLNKLFSPQPIIDEQSKVISSMAPFSGTQAKLSLLSQRLNDSSKVLLTRTNYDVVLSAILAESSSDISIASLSVDGKKVSMILTSKSLLSLNSFINNLKGMVDKKQLIKTVTVNNLSLGGKDGYDLNIDIQIL